MNISQHWRLKSQRYQLINSTNKQGNDVFPPRPQVEQRELRRYSFDVGVEASDMNEVFEQAAELEFVPTR